MLYLLLLLLLFLPLCAQASFLWNQWYAYKKGYQTTGILLETLEHKKNNEYMVTQKIWDKTKEGSQIFLRSSSKIGNKQWESQYYIKKLAGNKTEIIEGKMKNKRLSLRIHKSATMGPPLTETIELTDRAVLSSYLSLYLAKAFKDKKIQAYKKHELLVLLEEGKDNLYAPSKFSVLPTEKIKHIQRLRCRLFRVNFGNIPALWWLSPQGKICRIHIKKFKINLEMITEREAKRSL